MERVVWYVSAGLCCSLVVEVRLCLWNYVQEEGHVCCFMLQDICISTLVCHRNVSAESFTSV